MSSPHFPADVLVKRQRAYLLHLLAGAEGGELPLTKAAKVPAWAKKNLVLTPEAAAALLDTLIAEQLVVGSQKGKAKKVAITQAGREAMEQLAEFVPQPPPPKEKKPRPPKKSLADQTAETVRAKVAKLGDKPVSLKPPGGKNPKPDAVVAFEQTVRELIAEGKLFEYPGGKYGKRPAPTLAEVIRKEVDAKLAEKEGPFTRAALSKPKPKADAEKQRAHADALDKVIAELVAERRLFPHPGGKYGQLPAPPPPPPKEPKPKKPRLTLGETVRVKVAGLGDAAVPANKLGKPTGKKATPDAVAAFEQAVRELVAEGKLFEHPGGKYGQLPHVELDFADRELREVYVLDTFARAPDRTISKGDIELAFPGKGKPDKKTLDAKYSHVARFRGQGCFEMGAPATRQTLEQLVAAGDLRHTGDADAGEYALTDAGAERLKQARAKFPVLPPLGNPETPDDAAMRGLWEAFVLLRLADATGFTLPAPAAFVGGYPKGSKLNDATAWTLYGQFVTAGHLTARWNGTEGEYTLTPPGLRYLAGLSFDGFDKLEIKGPTLTALLAACGGAATSPPPAATTPASTPPADLESAVMGIFHRLLRERHANIRMVPIHEVRAEVRERFGDRGASREVFNELLLDLRRDDKVRLVSITDRSRATEQQLQDSVFAVGETFFYMEIAHAPVSSG